MGLVAAGLGVEDREEILAGQLACGGIGWTPTAGQVGAGVRGRVDRLEVLDVDAGVDLRGGELGVTEDLLERAVITARGFATSSLADSAAT